MANAHVLLISDKQELRARIAQQLTQAGYHITLAEDWPEGQQQIYLQPVDVVLLDAHLPALQDDWVSLEKLCRQSPDRPVILFGTAQPDLLRRAWQAGAVDFLNGDLQAIESVQRALKRREELLRWQQQAVLRATRPLQRRLEELTTLEQVGKSVIAHLELDEVFQQIVSAAVSLTGAEEGLLMLLDPQTGELYVRAAQNFNEDFVHTFRLPVQDSLAGQVLEKGEPLVHSFEVPTKIKTAYLIRDLLYVPLKGAHRTIGVLGVDNRTQSRPFNRTHISLLTALADYAVIAIENARLYYQSDVERRKLLSVLHNIGEGVMVLDRNGRITMINHLAAAALNLEPQAVIGKPYAGVILYDEIRLLLDTTRTEPRRLECSLAGDHIFAVYAAPIPEVGQVVTLQDMTYVKQLDHLKMDFVQTVSHDLRSPLTAILGYVELVERMGNLSEQQRRFLTRVRVSVHNITRLINTLLELGRIETGLDFEMEAVSLAPVVSYAVEGVQPQVEQRGHEIRVDIPQSLPPVLGNALRLRQLLDNLLSNAVRYTPPGGLIRITARQQGDQVILQVQDNGIGIPLIDQPYIFDKFYRGSNVPAEESGTGLGLAIVQSIVKQHQGRIWVESRPGEGSTFYVVLPLATGA